MVCQKCNQRKATIHLKQIMNGQSTEVNLCEVCAQETGALTVGFFPALDISDFLSGFLGSQIRTNNSPKCGNCGTTYDRFVEQGKMGCGECYTAFWEPIGYSLKKIHGNTTHIGKIPKRSGNSIHQKRQLEDLKYKLHQAIQHEEYEKAAELRDQIRQLEADQREGEGK